MRHLFAGGALLLFLILAPAAVNAQQVGAQNGFQLGLILGDPTGITLRSGLDERSAIQAHFGFSPFPGDAISVMVDWTYDAWNFLRNNPSVALQFYFGLGGKAEWFTSNYFAYGYEHPKGYSGRSHFGLGGRGLVGLRLPFLKAPFDLFLELAPIGLIVVVPDPGIVYDIDAAFGFRYRF